MCTLAERTPRAREYLCHLVVAQHASLVRLAWLGGVVIIEVHLDHTTLQSPAPLAQVLAQLCNLHIERLTQM